MKKLLSLSLAAALSVSLLAGCGGGGGTAETDNPPANTSSQPAGEAGELSGEITFWHSFTQGARMEAIQAAADQFMADNPGVTINIETMAWGDFNTKWNAGITTGDLPDMSTAQNTGEVVEMLNAGVLAPSDATIDAIGRDLFSEKALADMTVDGATYGIPYYSHAQVMWYRTDLLEQAGLEVPTTWDELYDAAVALTNPDEGLYGCAVSCSPNDLLCTRYLNYYVRSGGGSLLNDDLTANLTSDLAIEGINFWVNMYKNCSPAETINYTVNDHATLYYQGTTAFDFNSGFQISGVESNRPDLLDYISCAPLPKMNEDDPYYSAEATHIPLVVWQNSEHPEICQAFIEYLYQTDNYLDFLAAVPVGMLPSIKGIDENEEYLSNSIVQQFSDEAAIITEAVNEGTAIGFEHGPSAQAGLLANQGIIEEMFQDIITNGTDVETAAKAAEDELNEIFATMVA